LYAASANKASSSPEQHDVNYIAKSDYSRIWLILLKFLVDTVPFDPNGLQTVGSTRTATFGFKETTLMKHLFSRFVKDTSGATSIEYGLIAAGISVAIIAVLQGLGKNLTVVFTAISNSFN
jgi:pilus assembly protein Flp/PilA